MNTNLLEEIESIPIIDCHEHQPLPSTYIRPKEPIAFLLRGYFTSDLMSAGLMEEELNVLTDPEVPTRDKWPLFREAWGKARHTAYALEVRETIRLMAGVPDVTLESLDMVGQAIGEMKGYDGSFDALNLRALLVDPLWGSPQELRRYIKGEVDIPSCYRMLISLPFFHNTVRSMNGIQQIAGIVDRRVSSLDEFLESVSEIFRRMKASGAVGIKDQSAYSRSIDYGVVPRDSAERLFDRCLEDPNASLGWPEAKPLDDYLFHEYMRFARRLDLPVQVHTGHMAGLRNRVDKTNASLFTRVLELHSEVRFDLFHGNWPYAGDMLFLIKNYPNVYMNMCWVNIIDPPYSSRLLERAVYTAPHTKVMGFGGDYTAPELVSQHLHLAKRNICRALSKLIESSWLSERDALGIATDWLHNNPNRLFRLGFDEFHP